MTRNCFLFCFFPLIESTVKVRMNCVGAWTVRGWRLGPTALPVARTTCFYKKKTEQQEKRTNEKERRNDGKSQTTKKTGKMLKPKKKKKWNKQRSSEGETCALPESNSRGLRWLNIAQRLYLAVCAYVMITDLKGCTRCDARKKKEKKEVSGCCCVLLAPLMMQMKAPGTSIGKIIYYYFFVFKGYRFLFAIMEK